MEIVIALVFGSVVATALGFVSLSSRRPAQRRLARLADGSLARVEAPERPGVLSDDRRSLLVRLLSPLAGGAARSGASKLRPLRRRLVQAGYRRESAVTVYLGSRILLALLLPVVLLFVPFAWSFGDLQLAALLCGAAGLGLAAPSLVVSRRRAARHRQIVLGLPDALDLMVVCVEAGLGINSSLVRIAGEFRHSNPVLSAEFELVTLEIRAGKSSTEALRALAERTGSSEVSSLVAMLVQTERFGTNLADTLRVHADSMRVQRLQRAEEQAAKAPLKMLFPTVLIFAATMAVTIGPGALQLFEFFAKHR